MGELTGFIKAVSGIKEREGVLQIGFLVGETWYNAKGTEEQLNLLLNKHVKKGAQIAFDLKDGWTSNFSTISEPEIHNQPLKTGDKWQDDIVNYETLLNDAHTKYPKDLQISTELIDKDIEKGWAVVKATVKVDGRVFEGHGDATQVNCQSTMIKPHFLRMAETRAIARALRWATNNAQTAAEEK